MEAKTASEAADRDCVAPVAVARPHQMIHIQKVVVGPGGFEKAKEPGIGRSTVNMEGALGQEYSCIQSL